MNKKMIYIIIYTIVVAASIYVSYKYMRAIARPGGGNTMNYAIAVLFTFFSYINLRKLIRMIKSYSK